MELAKIEGSEGINVLNSVKSDIPKLWAEVTAEQDAAVKADANAKTLAALLEAKQTVYDKELEADENAAPSACDTKALAQRIATQKKAREAVADGKGTDTVAQPSTALPMTLFNYGYDVWMEGVTNESDVPVATGVPKRIEQVVAQIGETGGKPSRAISYLAIGAGAD